MKVEEIVGLLLLLVLIAITLFHVFYIKGRDKIAPDKEKIGADDHSSREDIDVGGDREIM